MLGVLRFVNRKLRGHTGGTQIVVIDNNLLVSSVIPGLLPTVKCVGSVP